MKTITTLALLFVLCLATVTTAATRPLHEIDKDLSKWLRLEATTKSAVQHEQAVLRLADLYREIMTDGRLPASPTLNSYRIKLRSRLMSILSNLQSHIRRGTTDKSDSEASSLQSILEQHLQHSARTLGGASGLLQPNAGAPVRDYGPALVNLIQKTIAPEFWDVNGGPGVIVYYPPLRLLVVRATSQIHHEIGGLR